MHVAGYLSGTRAEGKDGGVMDGWIIREERGFVAAYGME